MSAAGEPSDYINSHLEQDWAMWNQDSPEHQRKLALPCAKVEIKSFSANDFTTPRTMRPGLANEGSDVRPFSLSFLQRPRSLGRH